MLTTPVLGNFRGLTEFVLLYPEFSLFHEILRTENPKNWNSQIFQIVGSYFWWTRKVSWLTRKVSCLTRKVSWFENSWLIPYISWKNSLTRKVSWLARKVSWPIPWKFKNWKPIWNTVHLKIIECSMFLVKLLLILHVKH